MINWAKRKLPRCFKLAVKRTIKDLLQSVSYKIVCSNLKNINKVEHIVFVCTGNICRSAFAEHAFKAMLVNNKIKIESCGINVEKEICSPENAIRAGLIFNVDLRLHRSKSINQCDLLNADLILPMDYDHYQYLLINFPEYKSKIKLLKDFSRFPSNLMINIDDPYGLSIGAFIRCFSIINKCLLGLIDLK